MKSAEEVMEKPEAFALTLSYRDAFYASPRWWVSPSLVVDASASQRGA